MTEKPDFTHIDMALVRQEEAKKVSHVRVDWSLHIPVFATGIHYWLSDSGRPKLPDEQMRIITAPYDFRMLCMVAEKLCIQRFPEQAKDIESLFKKCLALNDDRVRVAHGLWTDDGKTLAARHVARSFAPTDDPK